MARKIKTRLEQAGIKCKLHCSLRVLPCFSGDNDDNHCSMLEKKIGIDCAGNVFACAWAGYVNGIGATQNPYYLGNLTRVSLKDILEGRHPTSQYHILFNEINNNRPYCSVISQVIGNTPFENHDPLSISSQDE